MMWKTVAKTFLCSVADRGQERMREALDRVSGNRWPLRALGAGLVLSLGISSAYADTELKYVFVDDNGGRHPVDAQIAAPAEQVTENDVRTAVQSNLAAVWSDLSGDEQKKAVEDAVSQVRADLREPWAPEKQEWPFQGITGTFDRASLQRGYQVYREVCSTCHSMNYVHFRNLADKGGPGFTDAEVKALAAEFQITDGPDESGDMYQRPGKPSDPFPKPFANDNLARASNGGALPPDLSLMAKARHDGPDYIVSLLTGYDHPVPPLMQMQQGLNYNPYFPGRQIAMPKMLFDGVVTYEDGTDATAKQMAHDVAQFLEWTAEPKLEQRKAMAVPVMFYLLVLTLFLYLSYKRIWRDVKH